jgi:outer membrane protein OmpA-like peptidoglycan-associated protein
MMKKLLIIAISAVLAGCAADDPHQRAKTGAAIGAVAGAVLGHQIHSDRGRYWGAAAGALAGAGVGNYMDNQQRDFEAALAEEQRRNDLEIQRLADESLKIDVSSEVSFDFGKADLKPAFIPTLDKVADLLHRYDRTVVHVIGHTDNVGSAEYNQRLSEQRAQSVVDYLTRKGIPWQRLVTEGRGFSEPRASNATEAGRQLNRRVELLIKPVVEGQEQRAYEPR